MSVTEAQRLHLFKSFEEWLPDEDLATLMSMLPPTGWGDIATKQDIETLRAATKQDIETLRNDVKQDIETVRVETKQDLATFATVLRAEVRADIADSSRAQTNRFVGWMLASNTALTAACAAIVSVLS